jgi:hypothetical protein
VFVVGLLTQQITQAQGTTYLSNLGQSSTGSLAVGSDSWWAAGFFTGNNVGRYSLNLVQLAMTDTSGNACGFTTMLYAALSSGAPGSSLGTLSGSTDPATAGTYTYAPTSNLTLSQNTLYYIVLASGTAVANGDYEWSYAGTYSYNPSGDWETLNGIAHSSDGLHWNGIAFIYPQFALNATPIPKPSICGLSVLSGLLFIWRHRKAKAF